ncbi:response regulator [Flavipsychrobacter stenotrophus]|uniref:Response regulator n=1 Tax=Flavipsychrobacter stenotrophus TaxID=2077091 RepID=A0A2S7SQ88_9BACT|nr:response regulator [Flavipsychrobacter stenotrophus]PQJ09073.1 response regulator [Flavipsychrobacter stenotrophus]
MNCNFSILLADDDDDDRYIFESALNEINNRCSVAYVDDGEKLINFINNSNSVPDIIVLDINMPKINGLDCLKYIKNNKEYSFSRILMLSTSTNEHDVREAYNNGASLYIRKPQSYTELKNILAYCISDDFIKSKEVHFSSFFIKDSSQLY